MFPLILSFLATINLIVYCEIVSTRYGPIEGTDGSYVINNQTFNFQAFLGIPFGDPPVGNKRFLPPIPFNGTWNKPYQATYFRDGCVQNHEENFTISEDCLYLNIWRPEITQNGSSSQLLPVYFLIFGSSFKHHSGATTQFLGDVLSASQKIITVNFNYRLGAFGFAYGSPEEMPGNLGTYDTLLVLRWVQDNIRSFGGDPTRVTLVGVSSGAQMVTILSSLPSRFNSASLFYRAIIISGSAVNRQQVEPLKVALTKTKLLAKEVNCLSQYDQSNKYNLRLSVETINCLKKQSADVILKAQNCKHINQIGFNADYAFQYVYGTPLIPEQIMALHIKNLDNSANKSMLFGFEQDESKSYNHKVGKVFCLQSAYNYTQDTITSAFKNITKDQIDSIFNEYFSNVNPNNTHELRSRCIILTSDISPKCPTVILSQLFSLVSRNIYLYQNVYRGQTLSRPFGTKHDDTVKFGQGLPFREPGDYTQIDREYSLVLMKIFGDFVKGIPFNDWPPVRLDKYNRNKLQTIKKLSLSPQNVLDHHQERCLKWAERFNYQLPWALVDMN